MNCERNDPGECVPAGRGRGKNAILLVCTLALLTCTFLLLLSNTHAPANATAAAIEYGITMGDGRAFAGPADRYELLAIYSEGITLTVSGRTEDSAWFRVDLSPYRWGWMAAENLTVTNDAGEIAVAATPEHLVTVTPQLKPALSLNLSSGIIIYEGFGSYPKIDIDVVSREPHTRVEIEIILQGGKVIGRIVAVTGKTGELHTMYSKSLTQGVYIVRVTDPSGNSVQGEVTLISGRKPTPTPKK